MRGSSRSAFCPITAKLKPQISPLTAASIITNRAHQPSRRGGTNQETSHRREKKKKEKEKEKGRKNAEWLATIGERAHTFGRRVEPNGPT